MTELKEEPISSSGELTKAEIDSGICFVCQGVGHWARECTSLPSMYLNDNAPRCYRCNGIGHFSRFCPNSEKQWRFRERRASLPMIFPEPSSWGTYFDDLGAIIAPAPYPEQMLFVRPEYASPVDTESGSSTIEYGIEDVDSFVGSGIPVTKVMIETTVEAINKRNVNQ